MGIRNKDVDDDENYDDRIYDLSGIIERKICYILETSFNNENIYKDIVGAMMNGLNKNIDINFNTESSTSFEKELNTISKAIRVLKLKSDHEMQTTNIKVGVGDF